MSKISPSLRIAGLVLIVAGTADARLLAWSHASRATRSERSRSTASSPPAHSSQSSDRVTWTTQRLGEKSYWYASNGTTCLAQKLAQTVLIRCY